MLLLKQYSISHLELKNRIVMAPMSCNMTNEYQVTDQMVSFFEERAKGGTGLITIGDGIVDVPLGNNVKDSLAIDDDKYIPGLRSLTRAIHNHGAKAVMQLSHAGRRAGRIAQNGCLEVTRGAIPVAPSILPHPVPGQVVPHELSQENIANLIHKFKLGAQRAMEAGFDSIGLHCAHMYLCGQFLSPWSNLRTDEYGGSISSRMRFVLEIIRNIKLVTGSRLPLIVRVNGEEPPGGNSLSDIQEIAARLEIAGVDAIHVSVGYGAPSKDIIQTPSITPMRSPDGCIVHLAENIKSSVSIPVIAVNKLGDVHFAENVLREGKADMIALGRPLIADPFLPNKAASKKYKDIRPCIYCNEGCIKNVLENDAPISCSVNPEVGYESQRINHKLTNKKRVLILGCGPSGLQCALSADQAGHEVFLYEKSKNIGGDLLLASLPIGKQKIEIFRRYLEYQLYESGVNLYLCQQLTQDAINAISPDVAVLATGAHLVKPQIKGLSSQDYIIPADILRSNSDINGNRVSIIGGGSVGCELAEFLSKQGNEVTIIEIDQVIARDMERINRLALIDALENCSVHIMTNANTIEFKNGALLVDYMQEVKEIPTDIVISALGKKSAKDDVDNMISSSVSRVYFIGDKAKSRGILDAIKEGHRVAYNI
ncbi:MAG: FAD-dependent oxidoreductase [Desulfovermiculus sp.]|nr:FAD-dependent oxidoreductase [Desulfovermiculus sp.]